ncbi:MAG: aspartate-semialdehyde dehydrogenase [Traorella sp.]
MKEYCVGILGASGAVGQAMLLGLEERQFPIRSIRLFASAHSAGKAMKFKGKDVLIEEATPTCFKGCDIVLGAVDNDLSRYFAPYIKEANALYIDNSSAFRLDPEVPLVVSQVNGDDVRYHHGIIANPNCSTIIGCVAVYAIHQVNPIQSMDVSTYQAVSGAGINGMKEYENQIVALAENKPLSIHHFPYQIASNLIPQIGSFTENGYTSEEMKMQNEGRRILHAPDLLVNCTCVRVPVLRSHSLSMTLNLQNEITVEQVTQLISKANGCKLVDDPSNQKYPMPLDTSNQDLVYVGRIRKDLCNQKGITLWCCGDQIRKGAAINAIEIAEKCIELSIL